MRLLSCGLLLSCLSFVVAVPLEVRPLALAPRRPSDTEACEPGSSTPTRAKNRSVYCDLSAAKMPTAPTPLPTPASNMTLFHVAIGRGTQNYTCDTTNSTAVPVPAGALASLYNATCTAAMSPRLLASSPRAALDLPDPNANDDDDDFYLTGHHYFLDSTTPFFNMDTPVYQLGMGAFSKTAVSNAPKDAMAGPANTGGDGAVQWLYLEAQPGTGNPFQAVYRLNTQGGSPPTTCKGMASSFTVQYAAEYWIYT